MSSILDKDIYENLQTERALVYEKLGISDRILQFAAPILGRLEERFRQIDAMAEVNQLRIIKAMQDAHIGEANLKGTTGYGYDDIGREGLEKVFRYYFHTEDALVRPQITCGTHALALAIFSNLRPGQVFMSAAGKPYDTLEEVIGIRKSRGSLAEYGIGYRQVDLLPDGSFDFDGLEKALTEDTERRIHLCTIQRSKGYQTRRTLSVDQIGEAIHFMKKLRPDVTFMVDNCYGEFTESKEPSDVGADMVVGSLIKNPGGGLAATGGYIVGTSECIENAAVRLTSPGLGKEVGASLSVLPSFYQGFFMGPIVTASALKGAIFAANAYEELGFAVLPNGSEQRHDIIQSITFGNPEGLIAFCQGIQAASPVDSFVTAEPAPMPGYDSDVIMAAGAFVSGSSIELSADGPLRAPYSAYFQGGLTWPHAKFGILKTLQNMLDRKICVFPES
ncbi:Cystathionine beta-lyase family protein involved in aluminum resistance [Lachnospiraceae bacterium NK3A20]|nr:Cystathionine beta-lyase family protein involved in aluminum resistance [Lachnospiraceae bacterium NK3A20]